MPMGLDGLVEIFCGGDSDEQQDPLYPHVPEVADTIFGSGDDFCLCHEL